MFVMCAPFSFLQGFMIYMFTLCVVVSVWVGFSAASTPIITVRHSRVYSENSEGYRAFRIPAIAQTADGTVVAFAEGRVPVDRPPYGTPTNCYGQLASTKDGDCVDKDIVYKTSSNGGHSWSSLKILARCNSTTFYYNPNLVLDKRTNKLWLTYYLCQGHKPHRRCYPVLLVSTDNAQTFSIVNTFLESGTPWFVGGLGGALQLQQSSPYKGRLIFPDDGRGCVYSDDHGNTWHVGQPIPNFVYYLDNQLVELDNGSLLMIIRKGGAGILEKDYMYPFGSLSEDGGVTWSNAWPMLNAVNNDCQVSSITMTRIDQKPALLMLHPNTIGEKPPNGRQNLTLSMSADRGKIWTNVVTITRNPSAYSAMVELQPSIIGCLYEQGDYNVVPINYSSMEYATVVFQYTNA